MNSGSLDSSISPTEDASLLETGQTKEDAIDVGKERARTEGIRQETNPRRKMAE